MRLRSTWILSALVVILLAYIGYSEWRTRRAPHAEVETVGTFDPGKVEEVSITVAGQTATVVREGDGRWSLTQPFTDPSCATPIQATRRRRGRPGGTGPSCRE